MVGDETRVFNNVLWLRGGCKTACNMDRSNTYDVHGTASGFGFGARQLDKGADVRFGELRRRQDNVDGCVISVDCVIFWFGSAWAFYGGCGEGSFG